MERNKNHVIINVDEMKFIGVAQTAEMASLLIWVNDEHSNVATLILPLEAKRFFSELSVLELLLLYKNTTGEIGDIHNYGGMITECYNLALALPVDQRSLFDLQKVAATKPQEPDLPKMPKLPPILVKYDPNVKPSEPAVRAPKAIKLIDGSPPPSRGVTGRVWEVAERVRAEMGGKPVDKEMRAKIIAECELVGINAGTAATQFGKWKATQS